MDIFPYCFYRQVAGYSKKLVSFLVSIFIVVLRLLSGDSYPYSYNNRTMAILGIFSSGIDRLLSRSGFTPFSRPKIISVSGK